MNLYQLEQLRRKWIIQLSNLNQWFAELHEKGIHISGRQQPHVVRGMLSEKAIEVIRKVANG